MDAATIHGATAGSAAPGPEGQRKLAGGGAKRNHRDQNRITITPRRGGGTGVPGVSPDAPAGARSFFCLGSGGSRSRRSLHHRLISIRPRGEITGPHVSLINDSHHSKQTNRRVNVATSDVPGAGGAASGPEGPRKLAGGGAKRSHRDQNRVTITPRRAGGTGVPGVSPDAPAGARSFFCLGSGGSRSLRSLHHRLISIRPRGEITGPHISLINDSHHSKQTNRRVNVA